MTVTAKVTSIALSHYGSIPSGHFNFSCSDGTTLSIPIDKDMAAKLMALALAEFTDRQRKIVEQIAAIEPVALIPYDSSKTIDDEIPH